MTFCSGGDLGPFRFKVNPELIPVDSYLATFIRHNNYWSIPDLGTDQFKNFDEAEKFSQIACEDLADYKQQSKKYRELFKERENATKKTKNKNMNKDKNGLLLLFHTLKSLKSLVMRRTSKLN